MVHEIKRRDIDGLIKPIHLEGEDETVGGMTQAISQTLRYCMRSELVEGDVTSGLRGTSKRKRKTIHYSAIIDRASIGKLLTAIDTYPVLPALSPFV